ncbi:glycosyltransferase [Phyllobacteriaceae bacterium JZ32]
MRYLASKRDIALVRNSTLFDSDWYRKSYPDIDLLGIDPAEHYLWLGARIGRDPSPKFSSRKYLETNRDVAHAGHNPLLHYIKYGRRENRQIYQVGAGATANVASQIIENAPKLKQIERSPVKRIMTRKHLNWDTIAEQKLIRELEAIEYEDHATLVSIIMPTRNRAACIGNAIQSALLQTHRYFELIIVDDGSSDATKDVVLEFTDHRIRYIRNTESGGVSKARNMALASARGQWVFFLDSDNRWRPQMIEFMLKHARRSQLAAGYCAANLIDDEGNRKGVLFSDFDFESCLEANFIDMNCFFFRRDSAFRDITFDEKLRRLVDWDLILRIAAMTRVVGLPYIGVDYYDGRNERITNQEHVARPDLLKLLEEIRSKSRRYIIETPPINNESFNRIAVVFHVFYPDIVTDCMNYLRNIRYDFDLFVTTSLEMNDPCLEGIKRSFPDARIFRFPNIGTDMAPFMELASTLKNYWLLCKIHTKRDLPKWGSAWRDGLLRPILGSPGRVDEIVECFKSNSKLKMVCSKEFYKFGRNNSSGETKIFIEQFAKDLDLERFLSNDWAFVAGTMFWARPQEFLRIGRHMSDSAGYGAAFQNDGSLEHGLERILSLSLWADSDARIGLASTEKIEEFPLGVGHTTDAVSVTLDKMLAAK